MSRIIPKTGASSDAKNNPVVSTGESDPMSQLPLGESNERVMRSTGEASESLDKLEFVKVDEAPMDDDTIDDDMDGDVDATDAVTPPPVDSTDETDDGGNAPETY